MNTLHIGRPPSPPDPRGLPGRWFATSAVLLWLTGIMSIGLWHARMPSLADQHVTSWLQSPRISKVLVDLELSVLWTKPGLTTMAALGGPSALIAAMLCVLTLSWWRRDAVLGALALIGPVLAGAITEWIGKPLVDRRIDGVHPSFPSGHVTTAAAIAALLWVAARRTSRSPLRALAPIVWAIPAIVSVAVLRLGWHVATDAIAGVGVGMGVVFGSLAALTTISMLWTPAAGPRVTPPPGSTRLR